VSTAVDETRLYSGWRKRRGMGIAGLTPTELMVVLGGLTIVLLSGTFGGLGALKFTGPPAVVMLVSLIPIAGLSAHFYVRREVGFWWAGVRGRRSFRSGLIHLENLDKDSQAQLPGALGPTRLLEVEGLDGAEPWAMIWNQRTGRLTVSLAVTTQAAWLADPDDFDRWVAHWHQFIASSAFEPSLATVGVVIDSKTIAGEVAADRLRDSISPDVAGFARDLLEDLADREVRASTRITLYVELSFDPAKGAAKGETIDGQAAEVARLIPGYEHALLACGIGAVSRVGAAEMGRRLRVAFDPEAATAAEIAEDSGNVEGLAWRSSGPMALDETRSAVLLDSAAAVGFTWQSAPRSPVRAEVLAPLLEAGPFAKRVTLLFVPTPAALGAGQLETERVFANARRISRERQKVDETARNEIDRRFAEMAANEEAQGAGLADMYMYVVVMAPKASDIPEAVADIEQRAGQSRIELRRATCAHASVSAVGLGTDINPPELARLGWVR